MKIEKAFWFNPMSPGTIGIVLGKDDYTGAQKGYIGIASGTNEAADQECIAMTGQKLSPAILKEILEYLVPEEK